MELNYPGKRVMDYILPYRDRQIDKVTSTYIGTLSHHGLTFILRDFYLCNAKMATCRGKLLFVSAI